MAYTAAQIVALLNAERPQKITHNRRKLALANHLQHFIYHLALSSILSFLLAFAGLLTRRCLGTVEIYPSSLEQAVYPLICTITATFYPTSIFRLKFSDIHAFSLLCFFAGLAMMWFNPDWLWYGLCLEGVGGGGTLAAYHYFTLRPLTLDSTRTRFSIRITALIAGTFWGSLSGCFSLACAALFVAIGIPATLLGMYFVSDVLEQLRFEREWLDAVSYEEGGGEPGAVRGSISGFL